MYNKTINRLKEKIHHHSKEYHEKTNRNIIGFYSNFLNAEDESTLINSFDENQFIKLISELDSSKGLDLILHASEGSITATESIINYLHDVFQGDIRVIIPQIIRGESSILACSSRVILMGDYSTLMTVDPKIKETYAKNIIEEMEVAKKEISENPSTEGFWKILLKKYPENRLEESKKAVQSSKNLLRKSLGLSMFKNSETEVIDNVVNELICSDSKNNHSLNLNSAKCREIGLNIKNLKEDVKLQDIVLSLHFDCIDYLNYGKNPKLFFNQTGSLIAN